MYTYAREMHKTHENLAVLCIISITSEIRSITETGCHLAILIDHVQYSMLDEVHLSANGTALGDKVPGEKHVERHMSDDGCDECFACCGEEWNYTDQILAGVV